MVQQRGSVNEGLTEAYVSWSLPPVLVLLLRPDGEPWGQEADLHACVHLFNVLPCHFIPWVFTRTLLCQGQSAAGSHTFPAG